MTLVMEGVDDRGISAPGRQRGRRGFPLKDSAAGQYATRSTNDTPRTELTRIVRVDGRHATSGGQPVVVRSTNSPADTSLLGTALSGIGGRPRIKPTASQTIQTVGRQRHMVESENHAKRFFADRIIHQAICEGTPLSSAERRMLLWSETDPEFLADPQLVVGLATEMSDDEFEAKICGLLQRAFQADRGVDPRVRDRWRRALAVLEQGDHYISIIIDRALGSKLKSWSQTWGLRAVPAAAALFVVVGAYLAAVRVFLGHNPSREESFVVTWVLMMALAAVYSLVRFAFGGQPLDDFIGRIFERIFRIPRP